jgi:PAS domain-containing protein
MEGVKSFMRVPIMAGGTWWGTVGFDDCLEERSWQPLDVETLRATAGLIGVAIAHDQTVSAQRDSERHVRGILESALESIITTDDCGVILEFNSAAEAMFGVTRKLVIGARIRDVISQSGCARSMTPAWRATSPPGTATSSTGGSRSWRCVVKTNFPRS